MVKKLIISLVLCFGLFDSLLFGGVAHKSNIRWKPGTVVRYRFLNGEQSDRDVVIKASKAWERTGANISFVEVKDEFAEVRISFYKGLGCWSVYGRESLLFSQDSTTMNLGFQDNDSNIYKKRSALHEFGHVLGLIHEHQNVNIPFQWNLAKTYEFFQSKPFNWSFDKVTYNVVGVFRREDVDYSEFDQDSIMFYPIPKICIGSGVLKESGNFDISDGDKKFICQLYPKATVSSLQVGFLSLVFFTLLVFSNRFYRWR